jgi:hypothetical protein
MIGTRRRVSKRSMFSFFSQYSMHFPTSCSSIDSSIYLYSPFRFAECRLYFFFEYNMLNLTDLVLDPLTVQAFVAWLREASKNCVAVVKCSESGCGITTMIHLACDSQNVAPIVLSAPMRGMKAFLKDAAGSAFSPCGRQKVLVIDPIDAVFSECTSSAEVSDFFRRGCSVPVIVAGHVLRSSVSKVSEIFGPKTYAVSHFAFDVPSPQLIIDKFGARVGDMWRGDLRNALVASGMGDELGPKTRKDPVCDGVLAVSRLLYDEGLSISEASRIFECDGSMIKMGIFENYLQEPHDIRAIAAFTDTYSLGNCFEEKLYDDQQWELYPVVATLLAGATTLLRHQNPLGKQRESIRRYGTMWSRGNNQKTKEKILRGIRDAQCQCVGVCLPVCDLAFVRQAFLTCMKRGHAGQAAALMEGMGEGVVLGIMRMWPCGYTLGLHRAFKRNCRGKNAT